MRETLDILTQKLLDAARKAGADQAMQTARKVSTLDCVCLWVKDRLVSLPRTPRTTQSRQWQSARSPWPGRRRKMRISLWHKPMSWHRIGIWPLWSLKIRGYGHHRFHLATSNGFSGGYGRTDRGISAVAITGEGAEMERDYAGEARSWQADLPSAQDIGTKAGQRTVERAGARKPPTGAFPVVFDERISSSLIGHLLVAANGSSVARGSSWLLGALGEQILPKGIDLIEDPHRPRISGSRPFDGEGLVTRSRKIVDDGILKGWTLDIATGRKLDMDSTANAARGTSAPPSPTISNVTLTQGDATKDELIAQMGTGLLVTSMIGSTINPNTGDYSRGASGFWVENGEIAYPVNECTIAGNLRDMLGRIIPANDAEDHLSRTEGRTCVHR